MNNAKPFIKTILSLTIVTVLIITSGNVYGRKGKSGSINLPRIPGSVSDFLNLRKELGQTPQAGAALFIAAMNIYGQNKDLGMKCFTIMLDRSNLSKSSPVYKGFAPSNSFMYFIKQLNPRLYLGGVYIEGTTHTSGYKLPAGPYKINFVQFTEKGNKAKLYIATTSGNRERPISLKKNNRGHWKVYGASSLFVGVSRLPPDNTDDDL